MNMRKKFLIGFTSLLIVLSLNSNIQAQDLDTSQVDENQVLEIEQIPSEETSIEETSNEESVENEIEIEQVDEFEIEQLETSHQEITDNTISETLEENTNSLNGWHLVDGQERYFQDGEALTGHHRIGTTNYYFDGNGNKVNGWHLVDGNERYYEGGIAFVGKRRVGLTTYLFDGYGNKQKGWHVLEGKQYYFSPDHNGGMLTGRRKIGNTTYLFHNDGYKTFGWHRLNGRDYYFSPNYGGGMITGKRRFGNTMYMFNAAGYKETGWRLLDGKSYYFNPNRNGGVTIIRKGNTPIRVSYELFSMRDELLSNAVGGNAELNRVRTDFLYMVNRDRRAKGLNPVTYNQELNTWAETRSSEMARTGRYSHTRPNGRPWHTVTSTGYTADNSIFLATENINIIYGGYIATESFNDWKSSTGHYNNMMDPSVSVIGLGFANAVDQYGRNVYYVTQLGGVNMK